MFTFDMFEEFSDLLSTKESKQYQFHNIVIGFGIVRTKQAMKQFKMIKVESFKIPNSRIVKDENGTKLKINQANRCGGRDGCWEGVYLTRYHFNLI